MLQDANRSTSLFSESAIESLHSSSNSSIQKLLNSLLKQSSMLGANKDKPLIDVGIV